MKKQEIVVKLSLPYENDELRRCQLEEIEEWSRSYLARYERVLPNEVIVCELGTKEYENKPLKNYYLITQYNVNKKALIFKKDSNNNFKNIKITKRWNSSEFIENTIYSSILTKYENINQCLDKIIYNSNIIITKVSVDTSNKYNDIYRVVPTEIITTGQIEEVMYMCIDYANETVIPKLLSESFLNGFCKYNPDEYTREWRTDLTYNILYNYIQNLIKEKKTKYTDTRVVISAVNDLVFKTVLVSINSSRIDYDGYITLPVEKSKNLLNLISKVITNKEAKNSFMKLKNRLLMHGSNEVTDQFMSIIDSTINLVPNNILNKINKFESHSVKDLMTRIFKGKIIYDIVKSNSPTFNITRSFFVNYSLILLEIRKGDTEEKRLHDYKLLDEIIKESFESVFNIKEIIAILNQSQLGYVNENEKDILDNLWWCLCDGIENVSSMTRKAILNSPEGLSIPYYNAQEGVGREEKDLVEFINNNRSRYSNIRAELVAIKLNK